MRARSSAQRRCCQGERKAHRRQAYRSNVPTCCERMCLIRDCARSMHLRGRKRCGTGEATLECDKRSEKFIGGDRHAWTQVASTLTTVCHIKLHQAVSPVLYTLRAFHNIIQFSQLNTAI